MSILQYRRFRPVGFLVRKHLIVGSWLDLPNRTARDQACFCFQLNGSYPDTNEYVQSNSHDFSRPRHRVITTHVTPQVIHHAEHDRESREE